MRRAATGRSSTLTFTWSKDGEDKNFTFGILPFINPTNVWVVPMDIQSEKEQQLQPDSYSLDEGHLYMVAGLCLGGGALCGFLRIKRRKN